MLCDNEFDKNCIRKQRYGHRNFKISKFYILVKKIKYIVSKRHFSKFCVRNVIIPIIVWQKHKTYYPVSNYPVSNYPVFDKNILPRILRLARKNWENKTTEIIQSTNLLNFYSKHSFYFYRNHSFHKSTEFL